MLVRLSSAESEAISSTVQSDTEPSDQMVSDECFVEICRVLLGKDAGFALYNIVEQRFEERTCYRYAAGDRKPPAYFLRALLRSEQGATFLAAVMEGSDAQWWQDHLRQVVVVRLAQEFAKSI